ncbi:MAG TPA: carboxymuconolactone decarboxylase family protein [Thermoanaerobaculia bacterium]|nr:carboxymuconolactone decarboxylase family protein [Thermoanaerobaculia bacterium]
MASRSSLQGLQKEIGFVPNLAATMSESPALIEGFTGLRSTLARSTFTPLEREVISLVVSFDNSCSYCMAAHSTFATKQGASDVVLRVLRLGDIPADARLSALATYTRQLMASRGQVSEEAQRALLDVGFTPAQLLEVIAVVAFTTIANYAHNVTHCPVDAAFQTQSWPVLAAIS